MGIASIGSVLVGGPGGKTGVVVGARPLPGASGEDGLVALRVRSGDRAPRPDNERPLSISSPSGETLSSLRAELADAVRERDTAEPAIARTPDRLSPPDRAVVEQLRQRDAQIRQEETAHAGVAGAMAGPISYTYQRGPDGRQYATGGSVSISLRPVTGDPAEARRIGSRLAAAAMAATNPSAADIAAASRAYRFAGAESADLRAVTADKADIGTALDRNA